MREKQNNVISVKREDERIPEKIEGKKEDTPRVANATILVVT